MRTKITYEQHFPYEISAICKANYTEQTYYIATFSKAGRIGILNEKFVPSHIFEPQGITDIQSVAIHPRLPFFVVAGSNTISMYDLNRNLIEEYKGDIVAALYSSDGDFLWCIEKNSQEQFTITVHNAKNLSQILAKKICKDELYDSSFSIGLLPETNKIHICQTAGQDGSLIVFAEFTGKDIVLTYPDSLNQNAEAVFPIWGENKYEFLLQQNDTGIFKYEYPSYKLLQKYLFPENIEYAGYHHTYLNNEKAIIQYDEQFWVLDLSSMQIKAPFYIIGHEPKETKHFYPSLADDTSMMTDIYYLERFDNTLIGFAGIKKNYSIFLIELTTCLED